MCLKETPYLTSRHYVAFSCTRSMPVKHYLVEVFCTTERITLVMHVNHSCLDVLGNASARQMCIAVA